MLTIAQKSWNLQKSIFILLFHHSGPYYVRKSDFESDLRVYDCLETRWLPTTSILGGIEGIYRYRYESNDLKNNKSFDSFFFFFLAFLEAALNFQCSEKEMSLIGWGILKLFTPKMCLFKCITGLVSEKLLAVNVLTSRKNSWNLQKSTFIVLFYHSQPDWVRKSYF